MITVSSAAQSVLASSAFKLYCAVESWRGGALLADSVPVVSAGEEGDRSIRVPERVTLTVPRLKDGYNWSPRGTDHPLSANGQRLHVKLGIGLGQGQIEWFGRGRFLIQDSEADGDQVNVAAVGMLTLVEEARLVNPYQPNGTLISTLRGLVEPALTVLVDATLTDRAVPTAVNWDEDRLGALYELLDAWPATAAMDPEGYLRATSATQSTTATLTLTDGVGGTVIREDGNSTRDGAYNAVVARGTDSTGAQIQGVAYLTDGPKAYGGPFNPLPVPKFFSSPLLTTIPQCQAAAQTMAQRMQRLTNNAYAVQCVPNPTIQLGDVIMLTGIGLCTVEHFSLPWIPSENMPAMSMTLRTIA
jgi:hypothetical protein